MPRRTDHDQRRRDLARTAAAVVATGGVEALTFRELATRAGVSVALVQHYFGSKAELLRHTLDHVSDQVGGRITARLDELGADATAGARLLALGEALLPTDDASRAAMVVYLSFAAGALTDTSLARGRRLRPRGGPARLRGGRARRGRSEATASRAADPMTEATTIVSLLLGLSLVALLPGQHETDPLDAYRRHLSFLDLSAG